MKKFILIKESIKKKMLSFKKAIVEDSERREFKERILESIMNEVEEIHWANNKLKIRWDRAKKLVRVLDEIIYKASDRGFSFNGRETLAELCECNVTTVDKAIKVLKESGQAVFAYGFNPDSNGFKTPIIFLKDHPYFSYWKTFCKLEPIEEVKIEKLEEIVESKVESKVKNSDSARDTGDTEENLSDTNLTLKSEIFTQNIINNNERNFSNLFNILEEIYLTRDQIFAKRLILNCPPLHDIFKEKARKIAMQLPSDFSELDYVSLANTIRNMIKRTPNKPISYFVKAFYKNKLYEANRLNIELTENDVPAELLPQKVKDKGRLDKIRQDLVKYQREGDLAMVQAIQKQLQIMTSRMSQNNCYVV